MGVRTKIFGMIGVDLSYGRETEQKIMEGLRHNLPDDEDDARDDFHDYFYDKGLMDDMFHNTNTGTYRMISDGMNGKYIRIGLILFESDTDRPYHIPKFTMGLEGDSLYIGVRHMIKSIFGLDVPQKDIKFMAFTHYS